MAGEETEISNAIRLRFSRLCGVLARNNRGKFRTLDGKRIIEAGLSIKGSSDLIGWTSVTITPDMVGQTVAIYTAIEVKTPKGRVSPEQQHFIDMVNKAGGRAGIARSPEEAVMIALGDNVTGQ